eukprot:2590322-Karenia_brevis.AAC.1
MEEEAAKKAAANEAWKATLAKAQERWQAALPKLGPKKTYPRHPQVKPWHKAWQSCVEELRFKRNFTKGDWGAKTEVAAH